MSLRDTLPSLQRVVVKVGSSSLSLPGGGVDRERVERIVESLWGVVERGVEVVLVSSGAVSAGMGVLGMESRPRKVERLQAAASAGQGLVMEAWASAWRSRGRVVGQVLLSAEDTALLERRRMLQGVVEELLGLGVVPVVNENDAVAVEELRFGDNDRLAALVAHLVGAEALVVLSDVDGIHTRHPGEGGERLSEITDLSALEAVEVGRGSSLGRGGMASKIEAMRLASQGGILGVVARAEDLGRVLAGEDVGSVVAPGRRRSARWLWVAYGAQGRGSVTVDEGAREAVRGGGSLLSVGVAEVQGEFSPGDVVEVWCAGELLGRGVSRVGSGAVEGVVVHRSDLALVGE